VFLCVLSQFCFVFWFSCPVIWLARETLLMKFVATRGDCLHKDNTEQSVQFIVCSVSRPLNDIMPFWNDRGIWPRFLLSIYFVDIICTTTPVFGNDVRSPDEMPLWILKQAALQGRGRRGRIKRRLIDWLIDWSSACVTVLILVVVGQTART